MRAATDLTAISGMRSVLNKFKMLKLNRQMQRCKSIEFLK